MSSYPSIKATCFYALLSVAANLFLTPLAQAESTKYSEICPVNSEQEKRYISIRPVFTGRRHERRATDRFTYHVCTRSDSSECYRLAGGAEFTMEDIRYKQAKYFVKAKTEGTVIPLLTWAAGGLLAKKALKSQHGWSKGLKRAVAFGAGGAASAYAHHEIGKYVSEADYDAALGMWLTDTAIYPDSKEILEEKGADKKKPGTSTQTVDLQSISDARPNVCEYLPIERTEWDGRRKNMDFFIRNFEKALLEILKEKAAEKEAAERLKNPNYVNRETLDLVEGKNFPAVEDTTGIKIDNDEEDYHNRKDRLEDVENEFDEAAWDRIGDEVDPPTRGTLAR